MRMENFTVSSKRPIFKFRDVTTGPDLTQPENYFESNPICFSYFLGKVFQLTEFQAKLFLMRN